MWHLGFDDSPRRATAATALPQCIAAAVYGNTQLWYIIAAANGLNSDADLKLGQYQGIPIVNPAEALKRLPERR